MQQLNRIEPLMAPGAYKTYLLAAPVSTHFVAATCAEVGCPNYLNGWRTIVPEGSDHADLVRSLRGRWHFTEQAQPGGLVEFTFPAGQPCFEASTHRRRLEREPRFVIRGGDHRGNPSGDRAEVSAASWLDNFGEHQERLASRFERG